MIVFEREKHAVFPELALVWEGIVQGWWNSPSGIGADTEIPNESIFLKTCHTQSEKGRQPVYESGIYVTFRQKILIRILSCTIYILSIRYWKKTSAIFMILISKAQAWKQTGNTSDWYMFHSPTKRSSVNLEKTSKKYIYEKIIQKIRI